MRNDKRIDYEASAVGEDEVLIRLLCSPQHYDKVTKQVSVDAFDLRRLGKKQDIPESFVSLGRKSVFSNDEDFQQYLQLGYRIWDDKDYESNAYYGHGTFLCINAKSISDIIEIWPLKNDKPEHIGMYYIKDEEHYFRGPLPKDNVVIVEMLTDLSFLISETINEAPDRK